MQDLTFIGGGFANAVTFASLTQCLRAAQSRRRAPVFLAIIDQHGSFGPGYAYGERTSSACLLNEPASAMIPELFLPWLSARQQDWLEPLKVSREAGVRRWLQLNQASLRRAESAANAYLPLYLPRQVFGQFLQDLMQNTISRAERNGLAKVHLMRSQAVSIAEEASGGFRVAFANGSHLVSRRIVLGIGSPPGPASPDLQLSPNYLSSCHSENDGLIIEDAFAKSLLGGSSRKTVLFLGSSAAATESLYLLSNAAGVLEVVDEAVVVSSSGLLPDAHSARTCSVATRVEQLSSADSQSAEKLFQAAAGDMAESRGREKLDSHETGIFRAAFDRAFATLPLGEKRCFVNKFGAGFARLNRHGPPEYTGAVRTLQQAGKLRVVKGCIEGINCQDPGKVSVRVDVGTNERLQLRGAVLVDCRGPAPLSARTTPLLSSLLHPQTGIARINECGRGIEVNEDFEASSNLYVIGPLLAGHSSTKDWLWNMESAPRIYAIAKSLADTLAAQLLGS